MRTVVLSFAIFTAACGASVAPAPRTAADQTGQAASDPCWDLTHDGERARLCVIAEAQDDTGRPSRGRVRVSGARTIDAPFVRVAREGAAGTHYETLYGAQDEPLLIMVTCAACGCGGCVSEVRVGADEEVWTNPSCPSVTLEDCP